MPLDPQARAYLDRAAALGVPPLAEQPVDQARRATDETALDGFGELEPVAQVEERDADGVPVRVYVPEQQAGGTLVWYHGGGWVIGSLVSHDPVCRTIAARSGWVVVSVGYRLAPEHPFPAAIDDCWTATLWAVRELGQPVAVGGDSAGGQLAASVALRARDADVPLVLQVLVYPIADADFARPSYVENAEGYGLTVAGMKHFWQLYVPEEADRMHPDVSPLRATNVAGVAPALVQTAEYDVLRDEGEAYAEALRAAGVPTTLRRYDGMIHGFFRMPAVLKQGNDALDEVAAALRAASPAPV
jgi:acetyl esterase